MNKEFEFLNIINKIIPDGFVGDDCAILKDYNLAISQDSLIEDVHFSRFFMTVKEIAKKALLVNISDILASGATPKYFSVALSGVSDENSIKEFYMGLNEVAKKFNIKLIGGDLTKSEKITISITVLGDTKNRNISSRKNARKNYIVACMGEFGTSAKGLEDLKNGFVENEFIEIHKAPKLYPNISNKIALEAEKPYAMMDSSDGLFDCLYQIAQKSNVRIDVDYSKIPKKTDNSDFVLYGGEDYSLVICMDKNDFEKFPELVQIGVVSDGESVFIDGRKVQYKGFCHFD